MAEQATTILDRIGSSPLLALRRILPGNGARILLKLENENPTGSMKDRMALAMIEAAESDGRLPPGGAVVEYTGGSTGVSLALVCAVKGHTLAHRHLRRLLPREAGPHDACSGRGWTILPSEDGRMTAGLTRAMIAADSAPSFAKTGANAGRASCATPG